MAISDLAQQPAAKPKKGPDCTVCMALADLSPEDAAGLLAMLSDPRRRYTEIAKLIADDPDTPDWIRGIDHRTYARHATRGCAARVKLR